MTEIEALEKSIEQWEWLKDNPDKNKDDYFKYKDIRDIPIVGCYVCLCVDWNCSKCLVSEWRKNRCIEDRESYVKWEYSYDIFETKKGAENVLALLKKNLKRVRNEQRNKSNV